MPHLMCRVGKLLLVILCKWLELVFSAGIICTSTRPAGVCGSNGDVSPPGTGVGRPKVFEGSQ